jgi:lipid-A-disaccharide synthase
LVDIVGTGERKPGGVVALLPGSRAQEVAHLLPVFEGAARILKARRPGLRFVLPVAADRLVVAADPIIEVTRESSLDVLRQADAALVASGTATLEAALLDVPCVAAYKVHWLTAAVAKRLLKVPFVSLPNIVAERAVIPELLQDAAAPEPLARALEALLDDPAAVLAGYADVRERLGGTGAIGRAADAILADAGVPSLVAN